MSWIQESAERGSKLRKHYKMYDIEIFIKDNLPEFIDADFVFKYIASLLPSHLMTEIDVIYIGQFDNLINRQVSAIYEDGAIYVTNEQRSDMDIVDDIVHEIGHSIEKKYIDDIYGDNSIEREFKAKRKKLYDILLEKNKNPPIEMLNNVNYSAKLDNYLYRVITYPVLDQICLQNSIFLGPYSATSIREYFASGFDNYFLGQSMLVRNFCPSLYKKINDLNNMEGQ